ncbi:MAG: FkbM family methyltransferase [Bacteroidota bacterium]|nr:FkbM family methyltransferase [Bacteroidota bacterium]MDP3144477.1 FkbM family methyltransferase [Bacteroidota bacterium]
MVKKIIKFLFNSSYLEKKLALKEVFFTDGNENITRLIKLVRNIHISDDSSLIIDVGAYNGATSILFSEAFPKKKIIGFEANPKAYENAIKNCINHKNITLHNFAISNKSETLNFYITSNDVSSSINKIDEKQINSEDYRNELNLKTQINIAAHKLDEFLEDKNILILKIDTQGHELKVLDGAKETLKKTSFVLIEMSNHKLYIDGCKYHEVDEMMRKNNFTLIDIIVTYRKKGIILTEYDAIYANNSIQSLEKLVLSSS